jgi:peptidoglycan/xylan/chitin deacetylase (PgdA/CDA1 family)
LATTTTQATTTSQATTTTTTTTVITGASQLIWKANTSERVVSLTFDAGSDRGFAEEILDLLLDEAISVTFGMTGVWAETNPDLVQRMVDEGHTLMNHTYNHPHMETLSTSERLDQLDITERIIMDLTGTSTVPYFRPPYGAYNNQVLADVGAAGYRYSIMWTVDSLGWKGLPAAEVVERTLGGAEPGAISLLHVGAKSTDFEALPSMVSGLRDAGYQFVTIPELIP